MQQIKMHLSAHQQKFLFERMFQVLPVKILSSNMLEEREETKRLLVAARSAMAAGFALVTDRLTMKRIPWRSSRMRLSLGTP